MTNFASNLRELREEHNLSQQEVANKTGIKQGMYSNYETGKSVPNLDVLTTLARFFRVSLDYLVGFMLLEKEDRDVANNLNISNAELTGRILHQGGSIAVKKLMKKEPNLFDKEIIDEYKKMKQG